MQTDRVSLCLDLWTAADGAHFIGIVAHFYCKQKKKPIRVVVGCRQIRVAATAENIAQLVQEVWQSDLGVDLAGYRIDNYLTDGGSNLVKCCQQDLPHLLAISAANNTIVDEFVFDNYENGWNICFIF